MNQKFKHSAIFLIIFAQMGVLQIHAAETENKIQCQVKTPVIPENIATMQASTHALNRITACSDEVKTLGYDSDSCHQYEACAKAVFGVDDLLAFIRGSDFFNNDIIPIFGALTSEFFSKAIVEKNLNDIEDKKFLRKYAEKIGIDIPNRNQCEDKGYTANCNKDDFEKLFQDIQKTCKESSGRNCYKLDDAAYTSIETNSQELKSDIFLDRIAEGKAVESLTNEKNIINDITEIIANTNEKNTKSKDGKSTPVYTARIKKIKEYLVNLEKDKKIDPYLKLLKNNDDSIAFFVKEIARVEKKDSSSLAAKFQELRKNRIQQEFNQERCESSISLKRLCEQKVAMDYNDKSNVKPIDPKEMSAMANAQDYDSEFDRIKKTKANFLKNKNEFVALLKGYQCYLLVYDFAKNKNLEEKTCLKDPLVTKKEDSIFGGGAKIRKNQDLVTDVQKAESDNKTSVNVSAIERDTTIKSTDAVEQFQAADKVDLTKTFEQSFAEKGMITPVNNTGVIENKKSNGTTSYIPTNNEVANEESEEESDRKIKNKNKSISEQIEELNKKLAATEDSLNSLKNKKSEDKVNSDDKNSDSSQIKSLENQIKSLKQDLAIANAKKNSPVNDSGETKSNVANSNSNNLKTNSNTSYERAPASVAKKIEDDNNESSIKDISRAPAVSSGIANSSSGIQPKDSTSKLLGLSLTKVDGMTNEAVAETINSKIIESNGQPFLIEEGGFVKEIVPVIKDGKIVLDEKGKPMFEKIIKGKVADLKNKNSKRAPASITSQADIQKAEQLKVKAEQDRQKYEMLKKLSSEAVK